MFRFCFAPKVNTFCGYHPNNKPFFIPLLTFFLFLPKESQNYSIPPMYY